MLTLLWPANNMFKLKWHACLLSRIQWRCSDDLQHALLPPPCWSGCVSREVGSTAHWLLSEWHPNEQNHSRKGMALLLFSIYLCNCMAYIITQLLHVSVSALWSFLSGPGNHWLFLHEVWWTCCAESLQHPLRPHYVWLYCCHWPWWSFSNWWLP